MHTTQTYLFIFTIYRAVYALNSILPSVHIGIAKRKKNTQFDLLKQVILLHGASLPGISHDN